MSAPHRKRALVREPATSCRSLLDDIGKLRSDLGRVRDELQRAHREIARLEELLAKDPPLGIEKLHLADLRRKVSFYCHPDRGGDVALMQRLNALFDQLER